MSPSLRRIGEYLGLTSEEVVDASAPELVDEPAYRRNREVPSVGTVRTFDDGVDRNGAVPNSGRVVNLPNRAAESSVRPVPATSAADPATRIVSVSPHNFNDASHIGEEIKRGHAVIMNLNDCDEALARRLVDYASGLIHGIDGKIAKISRGIFVISPKNVNVDDEIKLRSEDATFFNQS